VPPDGGGRGHFTTVAELKAAVADHGKRLAIAEKDIAVLSAEVFGKRRPRRQKRPRGR